jgi:thiamine kinase-like enzyme
MGGFHHRMWRLDTDRGSYAIKQLSPEVDLNNADTVNHYNASEAAAHAFARRGIAAVHALYCAPHYLQQIEHTGYLVYPWTDATAIEPKQLSERHALQVARVLARMHAANIDLTGLQEAETDPLPETKVIALVQRAAECNARDYKILGEHLPAFLSIAACQQQARDKLNQHRVVSHGDLDQKNVLWNASGEPVLIDWESSRRLNPTYETLLVALDWSGISFGFEYALLEKFVAAYRQAGGMIEDSSLVAALQCIQGDWLNWLMFNVGRSVELESAGDRALGAEQVDLALSTLLRLERLLPRLLSRIGAIDLGARDIVERESSDV